MPRPPNYKQNKQRREDARKKKNEEAQARKAARKSVTPSDPGTDADSASGGPDTHGSN